MARLGGASLRGCPMNNANFFSADLREALFTKSNMEGCHLLGVQAEGASAITRMCASSVCSKCHQMPSSSMSRQMKL